MNRFAFYCFVCLASFCGISAATRGADDPLTANRIAVIRFDDEIHGLSEQFLYRKLQDAEETKADLVVFELDSPGGQLDVMDRMIEKIRGMHDVKTVAYVPRQALSAAAIFSLACDEIVIAPSALFGDAGPIFLDEGFMFKHAPEKVRSHLSQQVRELAESGGRPPALAEAMVDMDLIVHKVKNLENDQITYLSDSEIESLDDPEQWEKLQPVHESRKDHFLEITGTRAVETGLADALVEDREALKARYQADEMIVFERTSTDNVVLILNHPVVTGLIVFIGLIALYIEFASPGIGVGGLMSIVCFAVFFWSRFLGGTAEWLEVVLFIAGAALIVVEIFILPGFGVWGLSGMLLMGAGVILAGQDFILPQNDAQWSQLTRSIAVFSGAVLAFFVGAFFLTSRLGSLPLFGRLMLRPPSGTETVDGMVYSTEPSVEPPASPLSVGDVGVADSFLRPAGKARFGDEYVDVLTDGTFVDPGKSVKVIKVHGNSIVVREV